MSEPIDIPFRMPGSEEAARQTDALANSMERLADKVEDVGDASTATAQDTQTLAQAAAAVTAQQQAAATAAINMGQRLAGAASAVQGLIGQLGGQSHTAGLIGATLQTSVQFAQLGGAVGPGGALVGGIVGALIPAIRELINAQDDAARSARALLEEEEILAERRSRMDRGRQEQIQREVESGHILTLSEEEITRATALAAERRMEIYEDLQRVSHALRRAEEQGMDHTSGRFREWTAQAATLREELVSVTGQINALDRATINRSRTASSDANETVTTPRRGGGGGSHADPNQALYDIISASEETSGLGAQIETEATGRLNERLAEELEIKELLLAKDAERANQAAVFHEAQLQFHEEELAMAEDAARRAHELDMEHRRVIEENMAATFSSIVGSMTDVLTQLAEGNATAEDGAKMMLAAFLKMLSQMAQVQALAEIARAISSYPDVAGIAAHVAGALAWGAVAVATGVGGASVSSGVSRAQAARQDAERPASPRTGGTSEGKGGGNMVINFNGPIMTAQTQAEFGRIINDASEVAYDRHPGGR